MDINMGGIAPSPSPDPSPGGSKGEVEPDIEVMAEGETYDPECLDNDDSDGSGDMETEGEEENTTKQTTSAPLIYTSNSDNHVQDGTVGFKTIGKPGKKIGSEKCLFTDGVTASNNNILRSGKGKEPKKNEPPSTPATDDRGSKTQNDQPQSTFKQQYYVIRAQRARQSVRNDLGIVGPYGRESKKDQNIKKEPGFDISGDQRQFRVKNFHDARGGRNVSSSLEPEGMLCLACEQQHSLSEGIEREELVALVLCDQNFPPILPTTDGKCISVVRVEDGRLFELEKTFAEILPGIIKLHSRLPVGSVVMVGSLSHLGSHGLESYAGDLVRVLSSMAAVLGGGVSVVPYVPIPLGGIGSRTTVRALYDLDAWILAGNEKTLAVTRQKFWEIVAVRKEEGGPDCECEWVYHLPTSVHNPRKRPFWSRAVSPALPKKLEPLEAKDEKILIQSIIHDLTTNFGVSLNPDPNLKRGVETPAD
jgi:hypothetical protein